MNFSGSHPLTMFIYFISVVLTAVFYKNPIFWFLCLFFALLYKFFRGEKLRIIWKILFYAVLTGIFSVAVPLVSHNGKTVLFFINDNAFTKEAVSMGFCIGIQISAVLCWFGCMADTMSGEKIIYLISGISSRFAVFVSRLMRFLPMTKKQFTEIYKSQIRLHSGFLTFRNKIRIITASISGLIIWIIENYADVSEAMYARGYGLSGRTSFSVYSFGRVDKIIIIMLVYTIPFTVATAVLGNASITFYPETVLPDFSLTNMLIYILWSVMLILPCITEICEDYKWKLLRSKI